MEFISSILYIYVCHNIIIIYYVQVHTIGLDKGNPIDVLL